MTDAMHEAIDIELRRIAAEADPHALSPCALRLARRTPALAAELGARADDPLRRALLGLQPAPEVAEDAPLADRVWAAQAVSDGGDALDPVAMAALEAAAQGDPTWWVPAGRLHVLASPDRERQARMALSDQELPYVFPGELHPMMVEVLAVGDRVLTSLHVDWMRKLTSWVADAAVLDVRQLGLWFWPILRYLDDRKMQRPLKKLQRVRRGEAGSRGLVVAYQARIGVDVAKPWAALDGMDRAVAALGLACDRPAEAAESWR